MNYYDILKIKRDATQTEIKKQYKSLIKLYHPDLYTGDKRFAEEKTMQINMAYDTLSVPELREQYDMDLALEEEAIRKSFEEQEPYTSTQSNDSYYDNDKAMHDVFERYERYKNRHIYKKHYGNSNQEPFTRYQTTATEEYINRKINQAEDYFVKKISVLRIKQKIAVFIIIILLILLLFMGSIIKIHSLTKKQNDTLENLKSEIQNTTKNGNFNLKKPTDENTVSDNAPTNETNTSNKTSKTLTEILQDYIDSYSEPSEYEKRLEDPNYNPKEMPSIYDNANIDTSILEGLSDNVKNKLQSTYDYMKEYVQTYVLDKFDEDQMKTILYHYLYTPSEEYHKWLRGEID